MNNARKSEGKGKGRYLNKLRFAVGLASLIFLLIILSTIKALDGYNDDLMLIPSIQEYYRDNENEDVIKYSTLVPRCCDATNEYKKEKHSLQLDINERPLKQLQFLHIPKNGGSVISHTAMLVANIESEVCHML